jgi:hypothetical protein
MKPLHPAICTCLAAFLALGCGPNKQPASDQSKPAGDSAPDSGSKAATDSAKKSGPEDKEPLRPQKIISERGGYSVVLPPVATAPAEGGRNREFPLSGKLSTTTLAARLGETQLHVLCVPFPTAVAKSTSDQKWLNAVRDKMISKTGKLIQEKRIKLDGHPGRDLQFQPSIPTFLKRVRVFVVEDRTYQIGALGPRNSVLSKEVDEFLDSFKLTGK